MKNKMLLYLSVVLVIIWMGVIFMFSDTPSDKSNEGSLKISRYIVKKIYSDKSIIEKEKLAKKFNKPIRKVAHGSVYFLLAIFVNSVVCTIKKKLFICNLISIIICFIYACSDEFHQMFVLNRSPLIGDVFIDTFGALIGCLIFNFIYKKAKSISFH